MSDKERTGECLERLKRDHKRPTVDSGDAVDQGAWVSAFFQFRQDLHKQHDALAVCTAWYDILLALQIAEGKRTHKGILLVWISDCFHQLGYAAHAKRYLMLTLCEDAITNNGNIDALKHGVFWRLASRHGFTRSRIDDYAKQVNSLATTAFSEALRYPEALLQELDQDWITEFPAPGEALLYRINTFYAQNLLAGMGDLTGKSLERLAEYLMSCMPGCRTSHRVRSRSTDYDIVCAMEGFELDFRSELGRYFICECKDWKKSADFTTMAKLCRILDSVKARFGILFSSKSITGADKDRHADAEQRKVYQDRGVVIVVIDEDDLKNIRSGADLINLLRRRFENVRLDSYP